MAGSTGCNNGCVQAPGVLGCEVVATLGGPWASAHSTASADTAVFTSSCFDALVGRGGIAWVALCSGPRAVQVLRGGELYATLQFPEAVAAMQLGAATGGAAGREAGAGAAQLAAAEPAVALVVVGDSCRAWAWRLEPAAAGPTGGQQPPGGGSSSGLPGKQRGRAAGGRRAKRRLEACSSEEEEEGEGGRPMELDQAVPPHPSDSNPKAIPLDGLGSLQGMPWLPAAGASQPLRLLLQTSTLGRQQQQIDGRMGQFASVAAAEAGVAVPARGVRAASGRPQLAAQVVWEHLNALLLSGVGLEQCQSAQPTPVVPIPLASLAAATSSAAPAVLHSVATWAASGRLPPDACCACYVAAPGATPQCPEFQGSSRRGWPSAAAASDGPAQQEQGDDCPGGEDMDMDWQAADSSGARPLGYLLLGTTTGRVAAFPVGLPMLRGADLSVHSTAAPPGGEALVAVAHGGRMQVVCVPAPQQQPPPPPQQQQSAAAAGQAASESLQATVAPLQLLLHTASGTVALAPPNPCSSRVLVPGKNRAAGGAGAAPQRQQQQQKDEGWSGVLAAVLRVSGDADCIAVNGRTLFYTSGGKLYGLNCSTLLEQARRPSSAGVAPRAAHLALPAPALLLAPAAAACASPASESQQLGGCRLLVLSRSGTLLDVRCPTGGALDATAAAQEEGRGLQDLEGEMQDLLGQVAALSASRERAAGALCALDARLAALAQAVPVVQSINCTTPAGLRCAVRPLYRLDEVVGAGAGAARLGGLALEVQLANGGQWALPVGHSLALAVSDSWSGAPCLAHAAPLPALPPGSSHALTCFLTAPGAPGQRPCVLRVLLCHHSAAGGMHAALLHSVRLDPLHLFCASRALGSLPALPAPFSTMLLGAAWAGGRISSGQAAQLGRQQQQSRQQPAQLSLRLQLPTWLFGRRPQAGAVLQALLSQGLSSTDLSPAPALPSPSPPPVLPCGEVGPGVAHSMPGWDAQRERQARWQRQQELAAMQLGSAAGPGAAAAAAAAFSSSAAGAWWSDWLQQRCQARALDPAAALSLLWDAQRGVAGPEGAPAAAAVPPSAVLADVLSAAGGPPAIAELLARTPPTHGHQAAAGWQHAEVELVARSPAREGALAMHAALARRLLAVQDSLPEQDTPAGLRLGGGLLLPQPGAAASPAQSAVEAADSAVLEAALCQLRQLKSEALRLRDQALQADRRHATAGHDCNTGADAVQERQMAGERLRVELAGLAVQLLTQTGAVPVILA